MRLDPKQQPSETPCEMRRPSRLNVPNALCAYRLIGSPAAAYLAYRHETGAFVWLLASLFLSDWLDGKLAILLKQRSAFGARLDSAADVAMYGALLFAAYWLKSDAILREAGWLIAAVGSYAAACLAGLIKFRRVPSYHTRAAKTGWLLVGIAAVSLFAEWSVWPLRIMAVAVALTNIESILITWTLPAWRADVPSLYHALRSARRPG